MQVCSFLIEGLMKITDNLIKILDHIIVVHCCQIFFCSMNLNSEGTQIVTDFYYRRD